MSRRAVGIVVALVAVLGGATEARVAGASPRTGAEVWDVACAACHGPDGAGQPRAVLGFDVHVPDLRDCTFATAEPTPDWFAVVHAGGPYAGSIG